MSASQGQGRGFEPRRKRLFEEGISLKKLRENERKEENKECEKTKNGYLGSLV